jgi:hypothetical protein
MTRPTTIVKLSLLLALAAALGACGDQTGYGPTHSYSARYGTNGTAADAIANNGSTSTSVEAQRQKVANNY